MKAWLHRRGIRRHKGGVWSYFPLAICAGACVLLFMNTQARGQEAVEPARELTPSEQKAADLRLPSLDRSALLPEMRMPTDVPSGERNPFGTVSLPPPEEKEVTPVEMETEEMKIRRVLGNMRVSGLSGDPESYVIQIGPMRLGVGDPVPRLFADQAEVLHVESITDRTVIFSFEEKDPNFPPRTIGVNFDLRPHVRALLAGDFFSKAIPKDQKGAQSIKPWNNPTVEILLTNSLTGDTIDALVERHPELMGEATMTPKTDEPPTSKRR